MTPTRLLVAAVLVSLASHPAAAQATRTWVSGVGDDANPCSRTAPCKTFAGAISKTAAGGEIDVLDPGGFGAVTITKSISIEAEGTVAGVLVSGTNGIVVQASATDHVVLRGLVFEGLGTGLNGVRFLAGGSLVIDRCTINGFTQNGVDFEPSSGTPGSVSSLLVTDTLIRNSGGAGILVKPSTNVTARGSASRVRATDNNVGIQIEDNATFTVRDSVASQNATDGFHLASSGLTAILHIDGSAASNNTQYGIHTTGVGAYAFVGGTLVTGNQIGLKIDGGNILSWGDNRVSANAAAGSAAYVIPRE